MMKVLRALYLGTCLVLASPFIIGWVIYIIGCSLVYIIRDKGDAMEVIGVGLIAPYKYAVWLYGNIIKYGNDYEQYSYDEFTI